MHEFSDGIGFHVPPRKNQSESVYDTNGRSSSVISLLGSNNDQLAECCQYVERGDQKSKQSSLATTG